MPKTNKDVNAYGNFKVLLKYEIKNTKECMDTTIIKYKMYERNSGKTLK